MQQSPENIKPKELKQEQEEGSQEEVVKEHIANINMEISQEELKLNLNTKQQTEPSQSSGQLEQSAANL